jgi:hypothetical protein
MWAEGRVHASWEERLGEWAKKTGSSDERQLIEAKG